MLAISGLNNFYYLPTFHDMRCKAPRVSEIIRSRYRRDNLTAIETKAKRNDAYTNKIVQGLRSELYDLLALAEEGMSDLMRTALNYFHKFWNQLFAYRKDGEYTIDNLAAERAIRPLTVQRKKQLILLQYERNFTIGCLQYLY